MENLGLRETFSRLNLSEVEPKVRYTHTAQQFCVVDPEGFILDFYQFCVDDGPDTTSHFDTYADPDPTLSFTQKVGKYEFFIYFYSHAVPVYIVLSCSSVSHFSIFWTIS